MNNSKSVFVIQSSEDSEPSYRFINLAVEKAGVSLIRVDQVSKTGRILGAILEGIQMASLIIADVSNPNPNVMYELGSAQAQDKPVILVSDIRRSIPFDLTTFRILFFDPGKPTEFVDNLTKLIEQALNSPETFLAQHLIRERENQQSIFISYSHNDREYLERLLIHLKPLQRNGIIELWVDTKIRAGDKWRTEIEKALDKAKVAILLVSADFLASDFIIDNELPPLLRKAEESGTRIVPLIVKPCRFTRDENLKHFQAVNDPKSALTLLNSGQQEVYYDLVASEVERWFS